MIREELDTLLKEAPEELKSVPGFGMDHPVPGQAQNRSQVLPQSPGNMSEERPEMPEEANVMGENTSSEKKEIPDKAPDMQEKTDNAEDSDEKTSNESGFFEKLINSLKSLFS